MNKLRIDNNQKIPYSFVQYLKSELSKIIKVNIDDSKIKQLDIYFNELLNGYNAYYTTRQIIEMGANNLTITIFPQYYLIGIDGNMLLPQTDIKLLDACKLINDGNVELKGFPIFNNCINFISDNIDYFYYKWSKQNVNLSVR